MYLNVSSKKHQKIRRIFVFSEDTSYLQGKKPKDTVYLSRTKQKIHKDTLRYTKILVMNYLIYVNVSCVSQCIFMYLNESSNKQPERYVVSFGFFRRYVVSSSNKTKDYSVSFKSFWKIH